MVRHLSAALALFCVSSSAAESRAADDVESLVRKGRNSLVVISHSGRDGKEEGVGAGFVVSGEGLIATALHVIGEGREISVRLPNGEEFEATEIHAWDRTLDLAILRIQADSLPPLALGDTKDLKQGQSVLALGNPLGLEHSVVQGIVSAKRDFDGLELIQIAIPIEPGNSGGPLLDLQGRVQGILTMKSAMTRNLGFAVPVNALRSLLAKPNPVPMTRWLTIGSLNQREWEPMMGARWRQKRGQILVEGLGKGFGGRSLCLSRQPVPEVPFELAVEVKLEAESGAAGLVFASDGRDVHYGFYPTAGQMRLTRFEGPTVFSWTILQTVSPEHYEPGEWNTLKVRVEPERLQCFLNDQLVIESSDAEFRTGRVGLAKFRDTKAAFKNFTIDKRIGSSSQSESIEDKARKLEREAARLRELAIKQHRDVVQHALTKLFQQPEEKIDLFRAALLLAKLDHPELDTDYYERQLAGMADELRERMPKDATKALETLKRYLFEENGFHGSRTDYYNRANSYINDVLDDREGLPITLTVLFIELARRVGLEGVEGIPEPGHFIARFTPPEGEPVFLDIFDGGKPLPPSRTKPATRKEIILRMLRNLMNAEPSGELRYLNVILALSPDSAADRFARAMLHYRAGDHGAAKEDLKHLLDNELPDREREKLMEFYRKL